ncbi:MAG: hypothetical protein RL033_6585 [Pseudomonadota bacterium]|jgi:hypothetical protein
MVCVVLRLQSANPGAEALLKQLPRGPEDVSWAHGDLDLQGLPEESSGANLTLAEEADAADALARARSRWQELLPQLQALARAGFELELDVGLTLGEEQLMRSMAFDVELLQDLAALPATLRVSAYLACEEPADSTADPA